MKTLRLFRLYREEDETGVSGTGPVCAGVQLPSGRCALEWITGNAPGGFTLYNSPEDILKVHGHDGKTRIEWLGEQVDASSERNKLDKSKLPEVSE